MSNIHKYLNLPMKPTLYNINLINASSPLKISRTLTKQKKKYWLQSSVNSTDQKTNPH